MTTIRTGARLLLLPLAIALGSPLVAAASVGGGDERPATKDAPPASPPATTPATPPATPPGSRPVAAPTGPAALQAVKDLQWLEDLDALAAVIHTKHVDPFSLRSAEQFDADVLALRERLPELTVPQKLVAFAQLVATLGDQHTSVALDQLARNAQLVPVALVWLADGVFVAATDAENQSMIGRRVVAIGGRPVDAAATSITSVVATENEGSRRSKFGQLASSYDLLHSLGLAEPDGRIAFTLAGSDGDPAAAVETRTVAPLPPRTMPTLISRPDPRDASLPISRRPGRGNAFVESLGDGAGGAGPDAVYLRYDRCIEDRSKPFATVAQEAIKALEGMERPRLIVDLRNNGGGDSRVIEPLFAGLATAREANPKLRGPNSLVVLVGPRTQSSASMNALELRNRSKAVLVGQPTGQRPNHLGEMRTIQLPNTGLGVWYSTKRFRHGDDGDDAVAPDILVPVTSAEWFAGRDAALEKALSLPRDE